MHATNSLMLRGFTAVVLAAAGCSSSSPFATPPGSSGVARSSHPSSSFAAAPTAPARGTPDASVAAASSRPSSNFRPASTRDTQPNPITATFKKTTAAIGSALKIEPKVVPASDATSITGPQPNVGPEVYVQAGRVLQQQGKLTEAEQQYRQALAKAPRDTRLMVLVARVNDEQGRLAEAEQTYRRALDVEPGNGTVLNDLGLFYAKHQRVDAAIETLRQAVQSQPANRRYRNNLAAVLLDNGRRDEALHELTAQLGQAEAHYNLGYMLAERGATQEAVDQLRSAVRLNPALAQAQTMLASLETPEQPRHLPPVMEAGPYRSAERSPAQPEARPAPRRDGDFIPGGGDYALPESSEPLPPF